MDDTSRAAGASHDSDATNQAQRSETAARAPAAPPSGSPPEPTGEDKRAADQQDAQRRRLRWMLGTAFAIVVLAAAGIYGWYYLTIGQYFTSTDDAYTEADNTSISPQISGYVSQLMVTDNQQVTRGETLLRIDDRPYKAAVDQSKADVASAEAEIQSLAAQIDLQQSQVTQADADVAAAQASLNYAQAERNRYQTLAKAGAGSVQAAQQAETNLRTATATLMHNRATLDAARKQLNVLKTQQQQAQANLQHYQAALEQAQINLGYTTITAPISGAVGDRSVRVGLYVQPGVQLLTVVPMGQDVYVVGNFKETEVTDMFRGQRATISVDAFPGARLHGTVDSLAPGSGAQFSLLPPENATGNFTKIVQRVPVKILLDAPNPVLDQIRPGLSVSVDVDTRTTPPGPRATLVPPPRS